MEKKREVDKLYSVFDLRIGEALGLSEPVSTRVLFTYDKGKNIKNFEVLNRRLSKEMHAKITAWLRQNLDVDDVMYGSQDYRIDADHYRKASNY